MPVNQLIKMAAIFTGCFVCLRPGRALAKGAICASPSSSRPIFCSRSSRGEISFGWKNVLDCLFGGVVGAISGIVCAAVKGKS